MFEQREEAAAAFQVEFAHDVVNEQNRRSAVNARQVLSLGHFQCGGQGALLAFAAELRGGMVADEQLQVVTMRTDAGRAKGSFAVAGLGQFDGKVSFDTGLIFEP